MTPNISDNKESISKPKLVLTVVQGTCNKLIYEKKIEKSVSLPCQYIWSKKGHQRMSSNLCKSATIFRKFYNVARCGWRAIPTFGHAVQFKNP